MACPWLRLTDVDWYKVTVPATTTGSMVVTMQANNLSSLSPKVTIFDGGQRGLATATNPNSYGGNATVTISGVSPGQVYYIRASAADGGPSNIGAFGLLVNFGSNYQAPIAPPNTVVYAQPDQGSGSSGFSNPGGPSASNPPNVNNDPRLG